MSKPTPAPSEDLSVQVARLYARKFFSDRKFQEAKVLTQGLLALGERDPQTLVLHASVLHGLGEKPAVTLPFVDEALRLEPSNPRYLTLRSTLAGA